MSFNFVFFNGEVKRDRKQEAMLDSLKERDRFLQKMNQMAEKRVIDEKKKRASEIIQKRWKRYRVRRDIRNNYRTKFDEGIAENPKNVNELLGLLCNFYESERDEERLIIGLNEAVRISKDLQKSDELLPYSRKLILTRCCIKFMMNATAQTNTYTILRFLDSFIVSNRKLLEESAKIGLFEAQLKMLSAICSNGDDTIFQQQKPDSRLPPPPRCQQVLARIFSPFEKTTEKCGILVAEKLLKSICEMADELVFTNLVLPYFLRVINSKSVNLSEFLKSINSLNFDDWGRSQKPINSANRKWNAIRRLQCIIVEEVANISKEGNDQSVLDSYFEALAKVVVAESRWRKNMAIQNVDQMETDESLTEKYLRQIIEERLDSAEFRKVSHYYANSKNLKVVNIVALEMQFLAIVDTLAASDNFMKLLYDFILKNVNENGQFNENSENIEFFKSALILFCGCIKKRISSVADSEFKPEQVVSENFVSVLHVLREICLKLINLVHPDQGNGLNKPKMEESLKRQAEAKKKWQKVCDAVVTTLQVVHEKDERVGFLAPTFWSDHDRNVVITKWSTEQRRIGRNARNAQNDDVSFVQQLAHGYDSSSSDSEDEAEKRALTPQAARNLCIMRNIPFIVPFMQRIKIFSRLLSHDRQTSGIVSHVDMFQQHPRGDAAYRLTVRRDNLYADAFEALAPTPGRRDDKDLRLPIRVRMINWTGNDEAGVDGGGIFREFLNEVLKEGFDVTKGLFQYTHNRLLYPNPASTLVYGAEYYRHYEFLGRMLGKLLYEKQLIELRFADFFIAQLLGSHRNDKDVDLQHMKSFDPIIFKHLRSLLDMSNKELDDLQLDFSIITNELDVVKNINLKPNGNQIRVTVDNVQEYVRLYVNYHLKLRIEPMVNALRKGVSDVISVEWLSMFSSNEIQILIAGTEEVFSISEMRKHCICTNIKDSTDSDYIEMFWSVVENLSADDKKSLLKFITGCSRPPIEGFQQIHPALGILLIRDESLLPTSATCMNMLTLPKYSTREKLEQKLRYSINSGAGFELM